VWLTSVDSLTEAGPDHDTVVWGAKRHSERFSRVDSGRYLHLRSCMVELDASASASHCVGFFAVLLRLLPIGKLRVTACSNGRSATLRVDFTARPWVFVLQ
jgi:hypothetical protein